MIIFVVTAKKIVVVLDLLIILLFTSIPSWSHFYLLIVSTDCTVYRILERFPVAAGQCILAKLGKLCENCGSFPACFKSLYHNLCR